MNVYARKKLLSIAKFYMASGPKYVNYPEKHLLFYEFAKFRDLIPSPGLKD